uniref:Uncharacterized protein n=1 Tax=Fagus sylvatica TaxID=28930 RepID=A0A2N9F742_FAGSY
MSFSSKGTPFPCKSKVPSANAIFFNGDRIEGTGNPVIERLSDLQKIAEILVSKFGGAINAWVIEASVFNGPFAVYKDFIPSVNQRGEPKSYSPVGFPASRSTVSLLSNFLEEVKNIISGRQKEQSPASISASHLSQPKTFILGFSKGGTVLNQLVTELGFSDVRFTGNSPHTEEQRISKRLIQGAKGIRFVLHGTPRQWCDCRRVWICNEKDKLVHMLESEAHRSGGKLQAFEYYEFGISRIGASAPQNVAFKWFHLYTSAFGMYVCMEGITSHNHSLWSRI